MNKTIAVVLAVMFALSLVAAADFTPTGNINLRNVYAIKNATNINSGNITAIHFIGEGGQITNITSALGAIYATQVMLNANYTAAINYANSILQGNLSVERITTNSSIDQKIIDAGIDPSFNKTWVKTNFINGSNATINGLMNNASYLSTYNSTYNTWAYNQTIPANNYTDNTNSSMSLWIEAVFLKIADMFTKVAIVNMISQNETKAETNANSALQGNISLNNNSWSMTSNSTYDLLPTSTVVNNSVNQIIAFSNASWSATGNSSYILGNNATINGLMNNASYLSIYNVTYANKADYNFTNNNFNGSGNITTQGNINVQGDGYFYGQPLLGMLGSGIIKTATVSDRTEVNVTCSGLTCTYPNFTMRIVSGTGAVAVNCDIPNGTFTAVDNQQSVRYVDNNCAIQVSEFSNYFENLIGAGNVWDFSMLTCHTGVCEVFRGGSIENRRNVKARTISFYTDHLSVVNGLNWIAGSGRNFSISSGKYLFMQSPVSTSLINTTSSNIEYLYHNGSVNYTAQDVWSLQLADCDNSTALVTCTGSGYRRYFIYIVGWNQTGHSSAEIVQTAGLLGTTYTLANCLNTVTNPLVYNLPAYYTETAVPLYAYCGQRTDTTLTSANLIDLRTVKTGSATGSATEVDPVWAVDKLNYYTSTETNTNILGNKTEIFSVANLNYTAIYSFITTVVNGNYSAALSYANSILSGNVTVINSNIVNNRTAAQTAAETSLQGNISVNNASWSTTSNSSYQLISSLNTTINQVVIISNNSWSRTDNSSYQLTNPLVNVNISTNASGCMIIKTATVVNAWC